VGKLPIWLELLLNGVNAGKARPPQDFWYIAPTSTVEGSVQNAQLTAVLQDREGFQDLLVVPFHHHGIHPAQKRVFQWLGIELHLLQTQARHAGGDFARLFAQDLPPLPVIHFVPVVLGRIVAGGDHNSRRGP